MKTDFVAAAAYQTTVEAYLAKARLEEAGIAAIVANEHIMTATYPLYGPLTDGIQVCVPADDLTRAQRILEEKTLSLDEPGGQDGHGEEEGEDEEA